MTSSGGCGIISIILSGKENILLKKAFVFPDMHYPYHDDKLFAMALQVIKDENPDEIIFIGDVLDCEQISKYHHNAYKGKIVQEVVTGCRSDIFDPIISAASRDCRFYFLAGNHENRINTFFDLFLAPLGGRDFVNVQQFLGLEFAQKFVPYMGSLELCPGTHLCHGYYIRSNPGGSVKRHMEYYPGNVIMGHTHRIGYHTQTTLSGTRRGWEIGHMTRMVDVPGWNPYANWQRSPGTVINYSEDGVFVDVKILEAIGAVGDEMVIFNGKEY